MGIGVLKLVHDMIMLSSPFVLQRLLQNLEAGGSRCASHWRSVPLADPALFDLGCKITTIRKQTICSTEGRSWLYRVMIIP